MKGRRLQVILEMEKGPATSRDIADATGIPFPNVAATLSYLYHQGIAERSDLPSEGRGPPERVYRIASDAARAALAPFTAAQQEGAP